MADESITELFWSKVDRSGGDEACWLWTAAVSGNGYGAFGVSRRMQSAHRVAWQLANGPIPKSASHHDACVLHRCDVRLCVNPAHLFFGSQADNSADKVAKGRHPHGEQVAGAKLTEADVRTIRAETRLLREIAADFGVTKTTISHIRNGRTWKHVR